MSKLRCEAPGGGGDDNESGRFSLVAAIWTCVAALRVSLMEEQAEHL
jgi:hypothetical protein